MQCQRCIITIGMDLLKRDAVRTAHQTLKADRKKTTRKNTEKILEKCRGKEMTVRERNSKGSGTEGQWEGGWLTGTGIGVKEKPDPRSIEGVV